MWKNKSTAIIVGVLMGISAPLVAMLPTSHHSEAAIAVFDQKNIEEAIKTAIQTAKILTEEEKQLAMMVLNAKKIDPLALANYEANYHNFKHKWLLELAKNGDIKDINIYNLPIDTVWKDRLGDVEGILNGNITVWTEVEREMEREKTLKEMNKQAAEAAKNALASSQEVVTEQVPELLEKSDNAEGEQQILQAGNHLIAQGIAVNANTNKMLEPYITSQAAELAASNARRVMQKQIEENEHEAARRVLAQMKANGDIK